MIEEAFTLTGEPEFGKPKLTGMVLKSNPCIRVYGVGPEGAKCGGCRMLYRSGSGGRGGGRYFKCEMRGKPTAGPGTDHLARWQACGKYEGLEAE